MYLYFEDEMQHAEDTCIASPHTKPRCLNLVKFTLAGLIDTVKISLSTLPFYTNEASRTLSLVCKVPMRFDLTKVGANQCGNHTRWFPLEFAFDNPIVLSMHSSHAFQSSLSHKFLSIMNPSVHFDLMLRHPMESPSLSSEKSHNIVEHNYWSQFVYYTKKYLHQLVVHSSIIKLKCHLFNKLVLAFVLTPVYIQCTMCINMYQRCTKDCTLALDYPKSNFPLYSRLPLINKISVLFGGSIARNVIYSPNLFASCSVDFTYPSIRGPLSSLNPTYATTSANDANLTVSLDMFHQAQVKLKHQWGRYLSYAQSIHLNLLTFEDHISPFYSLNINLPTDAIKNTLGFSMELCDITVGISKQISKPMRISLEFSSNYHHLTDS